MPHKTTHLMITAVAAVLCACSTSMPPDEMAAKVKACRDGGLEAKELTNRFGAVDDVTCVLPKKASDDQAPAHR